MTLTLWRGDQQLGELLPRVPLNDADVPHSPNRRGTDFLLVRAPECPRLEGLWQVADNFSGLGVRQRPLEPIDLGDVRPKRGNHLSPPSHVTLQRTTPEEVERVAPSLLLAVHNGAARMPLPVQLRLQVFQFSVEHRDRVLLEVPPEAIEDNHFWMVSILE